MCHLLSLSKHGPFLVTLNNYHHLPKWIALGEIVCDALDSGPGTQKEHLNGIFFIDSSDLYHLDIFNQQALMGSHHSPLVLRWQVFPPLLFFNL